MPKKTVNRFLPICLAVLVLALVICGIYLSTATPDASVSVPTIQDTLNRLTSVNSKLDMTLNGDSCILGSNTQLDLLLDFDAWKQSFQTAKGDPLVTLFLGKDMKLHFYGNGLVKVQSGAATTHYQVPSLVIDKITAYCQARIIQQ